MVLAEEIDEVWDEVRANHLGRAHLEAAQAGAMALRLVADLYERSSDPLQRGRVAAAEVSLVRPLVGPRGRALASSHEDTASSSVSSTHCGRRSVSMIPPVSSRLGSRRNRCGLSPKLLVPVWHWR